MAAGLLNNSYTPPAGAVRIEAGTNIQSVINQHGAGTAYVLGSGTHHGQTFTPRSGDRFYGENGTVLDGDGAAQAMNGWHQSDVTVANISFTDYAPSPSGSGILGNDPSSANWKVLGNEFHHINNGPALKLGNAMLVEDNSFHDNWSNGIAAWNTRDSIIRNNEFDNNNTSGDVPFRTTGSAGAIKITQSTGTQILDNHVHDTRNGAGIWADISCDNTLIQGNLVERNGAGGIFVELDYGSTVRNNTVVGNNPGLLEGFGGGGLYLFNTQDAEVSGNTFRDNGGGIWVYEENRGSGTQGTWQTSNVNVHDNTVIADQGRNGIGGTATGDGSIRFSSNDYDLSGSASFFNGRPISQSEWQSLGFDSAASGATFDGSGSSGSPAWSPPPSPSPSPSPSPAPAEQPGAGDGADTLVLKISQDAWQGNAQYTLAVDGVAQGGVRTASASHRSGGTDTVTLQGDWDGGWHQLSVNFLNDAYGGRSSADRNLYLEEVSFNGEVVSDDTLAFYRGGSQTVGFSDVF